jgi:hypothetical protein
VPDSAETREVANRLRDACKTAESVGRSWTIVTNTDLLCVLDALDSDGTTDG